MTSEWLLNMSIKFYTSPNFFLPPKTNFWLHPWFVTSWLVLQCSCIICKVVIAVATALYFIAHLLAYTVLMYFILHIAALQSILYLLLMLYSVILMQVIPWYDWAKYIFLSDTLCMIALCKFSVNSNNNKTSFVVTVNDRYSGTCTVGLEREELLRHLGTVTQHAGFSTDFTACSALFTNSNNTTQNNYN